MIKVAFMNIRKRGYNAISECLKSILSSRFKTKFKLIYLCIYKNDFYAVVTDPIINHLGDIYQYVGDEIVVSWDAERVGIVDNCITCFFEIKNSIQLEKEKFIHRYGVFPEFKAGIHCGVVTVGEIGVMKRDIVYSGDVLNTTSRIQEACNVHNAELLVSEDVIDLLNHPDSYQINPIGELSLKGKMKKISVSALKTFK